MILHKNPRKHRQLRVVLLAQHYAPEEVSGAVLATELAADLVERGHSVTFVTCAPNYPEGKVYPGYKNQIYDVEMRDGVRVVRVWSYISPLKTFWRRVLNYGTFSVGAFWGGLLQKKPDVLLSYSPPLPLGCSAAFLSRLWRVPWVLRIEDLYPDAAIAAGVLENELAIRALYRVERFLYSQADHISLISEGFRAILEDDKDVPAEKLSVIPVWADPDVVRPLPRENRFRDAHTLNGQFVVMYAGNLGHTSALEDVLVAAEHLKGVPAIHFVVVGEGVKKASLCEQAEQAELENVLFLPYQPRDMFSEMMAAADVGLVTLNYGSSRTSLPSKTFNIMSSGRPVLGVTPADSEIARLIERTDCGVNVPPERPRQLAQMILKLNQDRAHLEEMGRRGRAEIESTFSRQRCVDLFEATLQQVVE